jgi:ribose transport system substrate-binding protein
MGREVMARRLAIVATLIGLAGFVAACGSSNSSSSSGTSQSSSAPTTRTVNLGAGPVKVGGHTLRIAFMTAASVNDYSKAYNKGAQDEASRLGVNLTTFDANLDPVKQVDQARTALASNKYDAWIITALSPQMCSITKQAIAKGILVIVANQPVCKSEFATGTGLWLPGTVAFAGGDQTADLFKQWLTKIAQLNPGPQQVALVQGTPDLSQSLLSSKAAKEVEATDPQFKVTTIAVPTYDISGANAKVKTFLPAHQNLTILATVYSDMTRGAVTALQQAGTKNVKVYDMGGSKWAFSAVRAGTVQLTSVFLPATAGKLQVQTLNEIWSQGKPAPKYINVLSSVSNPFVTKADIANRQAEY